MARIRTIKPEFWTSEQVVECSPIARLLFIGMWNHCDDAGRHQASLKRLKMEVFPGDGFSDSEIGSWVTELIKNGLLIEYESQGEIYWQVTGWKHQKIEKPTVRFPGPEECKIPQPIADHSSNTRRPVADSSPPEGNGREGSIKKANTSAPMEIQCEPDLKLETTEEFIARWKPRIKPADFKNLGKGNLFVDEAIRAGLSGEADRLRILTLWHRMSAKVAAGTAHSPTALFLSLWKRAAWAGGDGDESYVSEWLRRRRKPTGAFPDVLESVADGLAVAPVGGFE